MRLFFTSIFLSIFCVNICAQSNFFDSWFQESKEELKSWRQEQNALFEEWAQQKRDEYNRWRQMRDGILPRDEMDDIGGFINQNFSSTTSTSGRVRNLPAAKLWVVIVGVADYRNQELNLKYTKDDAYRVYAFYKSPEGGSLPDSQIAFLIDWEATRNNILKAINNIYSQANYDDAIIFYFAGHGTKSAFLTHEFRDTGEEKITGQLLHSELNDIFQKSPARYKYLIADACHAGSFANVSSGNKNNVSSKSGFYQAFEETHGGFVMILSSMSSEYSFEEKDIMQGIFSHFLIRGLKGESDKNKDKIVTVDELFDFVEMNVKTFTRNAQNPVISGNYKDILPMAMLRE